MALSTLLFGDGPADTGWTFYAPYSVKTGTNVTMSVLAAFDRTHRLNQQVRVFGLVNGRKTQSRSKSWH